MHTRSKDGKSIPARSYSEEQWLVARRIARELDRILECSGPKGIAVGIAATELGLGRRQIYYLLARYRTTRRITSLLSRAPYHRRKRVCSDIEGIISDTLQQQWLVTETPPLAPVVAEIQARCVEAGLSPPSYGTVSRRIPALFTPEMIAKGRYSDTHRLLRLKPRPGYIHSESPLSVCQIDHTPTDINFVEVIEGGGRFVGRAYLTLVTDVCTRSILGFCLTLEKPSVLSVGLCMAQAMCPKQDWLASRAINHDWPMFGRPRVLVTDSAKEFKGNAFQRGCEEYGIEIRYRNRYRVHEGGVVERLLGKLNAVLASYPGSTGRSVSDRKQYPSQKRARISFAQLEQCITLAVIDHNHQQNNRTLRVPAVEWHKHADDLHSFHDQTDDVLLTFLPRTERRLTPQGVSMFSLDYYSPWLGRLVALRDRLLKLEIRYDPRDISHIYIRDPDTAVFQPVSRRDGILRSMTLWEHRADRAGRRASGARSELEKVVLRREISAIVGKTKRVRNELRNAVRNTHAADAPKPYENMQRATNENPPHPNHQKRRLPVEDW